MFLKKNPDPGWVVAMTCSMVLVFNHAGRGAWRTRGLVLTSCGSRQVRLHLERDPIFGWSSADAPN